MIETSISITLNRKSDIALVKRAIKNCNIVFPVFILEFENSYIVKLTSDYEYYEIDKAITSELTEYEFQEELVGEKINIRMKIERYQSPHSTDGWGRYIEDPLNQTLYLIDKNQTSEQIYIPKISVVQNNTEEDYFINITEGRKGEETGYVILNSFQNIETMVEEIDTIMVKQVFKDEMDAYWKTFQIIEQTALEKFEQSKKKKGKK